MKETARSNFPMADSFILKNNKKEFSARHTFYGHRLLVGARMVGFKNEANNMEQMSNIHSLFGLPVMLFGLSLLPGPLQNKQYCEG